MDAADVIPEVEAELPAELESVIVARQLVVNATAEWRLEREAAEDTALITSELVTNVVFHAGTRMTFRILRLGPGVRIEVIDGNPRLPSAGFDSPEDLLELRSTTGRGLSLVAALSDRWGTEPRGDGKVVWAEVATGRRMVKAVPAPSFPPPPPAPVVDGSAFAAGIRGVAAVAATGRQVHLIGVPVRLLVESVRQFTDLQREIQVIGLAHHGPEELQALADSTREIESHIGHLRESGLHAAEAALARGETVVDIDVVVPEDTREQLDLLGVVLSKVREKLVRGYLLTLPASKEVSAYRLWWRKEVLSQLAGNAPSPCPMRLAKGESA